MGAGNATVQSDTRGGSSRSTRVGEDMLQVIYKPSMLWVFFCLRQEQAPCVRFSASLHKAELYKRLQSCLVGLPGREPPGKDLRTRLWGWTAPEEEVVRIAPGWPMPSHRALIESTLSEEGEEAEGQNWSWGWPRGGPSRRRRWVSHHLPPVQP